MVQRADPLALRELVRVRRAAETSAVVGRPHAAGRHLELGVYGLVVDVHHAAVQALGHSAVARATDLLWIAVARL